MTEEGFKRKLTAILSADVEGYSRLMGEDEDATIRTLTTYRELMSTLIQKHRGRVVDSPGDNLLAEFTSVVDAVRCAVEIQEELRVRNAELPENRKMQFRIGINLGDVVQEGERIYGDGVNIASRIEGLADGGGICISGTVYDSIKNKLSLSYESLGEHTVKNITEPVRVYRMRIGPEAAAPEVREEKAELRRWHKAALAAVVVLIVAAGAWAIWNFYFRPPPIQPASVEKMAFPLPDKPSIAVLPFVNMSEDPKQEFFSDGMTEEIITALSKVPNLFVIARNSTFTYKGKPVKINQVSEELGVRYVLEGSVRRSKDKVRITAQLIDAMTGHHLWAERYDRDLKDIFTLQDEITMKIITALQVKLTIGEQARVFARRTENLEAYLQFLQAVETFFTVTKEGNAQARRLVEEVINLDPEFPAAYDLLGSINFMDVSLGLSKSPKKSLKQAFELTKKAIALDDSYAIAHSHLGWLYLIMNKQHDKAIAECERAIELAPNSASAHIWMGLVLTLAGRHQEAVRYSEQALRLNPIPPGWYIRNLGFAYFGAGRYEEAIAAHKKSLQRAPNDIITHLWLTAAYSWAGHLEEARAQAAEVLRINSKFSVEQQAKRSRYKNQADRKRYLDGLRKAGLPETPPLPLPDEPSIAVLPFTNMSEDPKQEYFSDGITEEIITALSKTPKLFVIARNSTFTYKGKPVKVQQVGRELGVRYVLEGSVRKAGDRVRITAQLVDTTTGNHLWADRYDRELKDIFALQDEITMKVITALQIKLTEGGLPRLRPKGTNNLEAFLNYLKGNEFLLRFDKEGNFLARKMCEKAIALDPEYAVPHLIMAWAYMNDATFGWSKTPKKDMSRAYELAQKALALDPLIEDRVCLVLSGIHMRKRELKKTIALRERAVALNPNMARFHAFLGVALTYGGRSEEAIEVFKKAIRLNPFPPDWYLHYFGLAYHVTGQHEKAIEKFKSVINRNPDFWLSYSDLTMCYAFLGREEEARAAASEVLRMNPTWSFEKAAKKIPFKNKVDKERLLAALRRAGLK